MYELLVKVVLYTIRHCFYPQLACHINWLAKIPPYYPQQWQLQQWQQVEKGFEDYQLWIQHHALWDTDIWLKRFYQARAKRPQKLISIVTPVYNPDPFHLRECIASVQLQGNPYWQWIIVDDGSTDVQVREILRGRFSFDPRVQVIFPGQKQQGISATTNIAIQHACGDYILFLDHDDRLEPGAIDALHQAIREQDYDIIYSDRDMISVNNKRFMHLMKPDWSPHTLLSGNYIFHLMAYRRVFLDKTGLLQSEFDGSQDYDLVLRASEHQPVVKHIPQVLYHWRQHAQSVALNENAKDFAFDAGIRALKAHLARRKIAARARENQSMYRGNYYLIFPYQAQNQPAIIRISRDTNHYARSISEQIAQHPDCESYLILAEDIPVTDTQQLAQLCGWMQFAEIAMVSPMLINPQGKILYAGMSYTPDRKLLSHYYDFSDTEAGYMGSVQNTRNISVPNPWCILIRARVWRQLRGFHQSYADTLAMLDFAWRARARGAYLLYTPQSRFVLDEASQYWHAYDTISKEFAKQWQDRFVDGDPFYAQNLCQDCVDMALPENAVVFGDQRTEDRGQKTEDRG